MAQSDSLAMHVYSTLYVSCAHGKAGAAPLVLNSAPPIGASVFPPAGAGGRGVVRWGGRPRRRAGSASYSPSWATKGPMWGFSDFTGTDPRSPIEQNGAWHRIGFLTPRRPSACKL